MEEQLLGRKRLEQDTRRIRTLIPQLVALTSPLTSTSWDGDAFSTTAKTQIDLSSVFSVPAGVRMINAKVEIRDSGSAGNVCWLILSPNDTASEGCIIRCTGLPNDTWTSEMMCVPCDANGDVYYQIQASGASALDAIIQVWGYWI